MKILIVDDHVLIRQGIRELVRTLSPDATVLEAGDSAGALALVAAEPALDLVLLDLMLPGTDGMSTLDRLRARHPGIPVVVLSSREDRADIVDALDRGAMGFIPKSFPAAAMLDALRHVLSGGVFLPPENGTAAAAYGRGPATTPSDLGLTDRQAQVLALLVQGKPNKLICRELGLAVGTVKIHMTGILKALGVTSRTQAVIAVSRMGIRLDQAQPVRADRSPATRAP
jgi:DNA-binding NarL/FixJ family response regulator